MSKSSRDLVLIIGTLRMPSTEDDHQIVCWVDTKNNSLQVCWPDGSRVSGSVLMIAPITLGENPACPVPRAEVIAALTTYGCTVTADVCSTPPGLQVSNDSEERMNNDGID
jgi:hypothetical protein